MGASPMPRKPASDGIEDEFGRGEVTVTEEMSSEATAEVEQADDPASPADMVKKMNPPIL